VRETAREREREKHVFTRKQAMNLEKLTSHAYILCIALVLIVVGTVALAARSLCGGVI
jgi:uncharacterized membrane protein YidH (DUF202 family)